MALDAIRIDDDEFCFATLDLIERSFAVTLPSDLRHIATAGDLFEQVLYRRQDRAAGEKCDSAMVFFRLRSTFARLAPGVRITPSTRLKDLTRMSPKRLAKRLARETGLAMPAVDVGRLGCAMVLLGFIGAPLLWWLVDFPTAAFTLFGAGMVSLLDRGGYSGDWQTVWSLVEAIARRNVAQLGAMGARNRPEDWWRRFAEILALASEPLPNGARLVDARQIGRETRLELV